jgi:hypothetical protein
LLCVLANDSVAEIIFIKYFYFLILFLAHNLFFHVTSPV